MFSLKKTGEIAKNDVKIKGPAKAEQENLQSLIRSELKSKLQEPNTAPVNLQKEDTDLAQAIDETDKHLLKGEHAEDNSFEISGIV